jgi:hypothetical protein
MSKDIQEISLALRYIPMSFGIFRHGGGEKAEKHQLINTDNSIEI